MQRPQSLRVTLLFVGAIIVPSILLSVLALRAIEAERVALIRRVEQRTELAARSLAASLNTALTEVSEDIATTASSLGSADSAASTLVPVMAALLDSGNLPVDSVLVLNASGERIFPPPHRGLGSPAQGPSLQEGNDSNAMFAAAEAAEFGANGSKSAVTAWESLARRLRGQPSLRAEALLALGRVHAGNGDLYNAYECFTAVIDETPRHRDRHGLPLDLAARVQLASIWQRLGNADRQRETLLDLLDALMDRRRELSVEEVDLYLEQALGDLPNQDDEANLRMAEYRAVAQELARQESQARRLEAAFGPALSERLTEHRQGPSARFLKWSGGPQREPLVAVLLDLPGTSPTSTLAGVAVLRLSLQRFLTGAASQLVAAANRTGESIHSLAPRQPPQQPEADKPSGDARDEASRDPAAVANPESMSSRIPLEFPLEHLEVRSHPRGAVELEQLRSTGGDVLRWVIALSVLGIILGAVGATRAIAREMRIAQQKTDFVSNVTHELRTPLTSIGIFIETLEEDRVENAEERAEVIALMARERDRLSTLIERLLAFSRIEAGRYHYDFRMEDPTAMLQQALERFIHELSTAGRPLLPVEVTSVQALNSVAVDRDALEEVLLNLLHNADKYTPGPDRRVRITLSQRRRRLWIEIEDNGLGVEPRDRRRIFKKFERGSDAQTSQVAGSGIGLTLALSILRAHGGDLRYAPARPRGSRFTVILPLPRSVKKAPGAPDDPDHDHDQR